VSQSGFYSFANLRLRLKAALPPSNNTYLFWRFELSLKSGAAHMSWHGGCIPRRSLAACCSTGRNADRWIYPPVARMCHARVGRGRENPDRAGTAAQLRSQPLSAYSDGLVRRRAGCLKLDPLSGGQGSRHEV